jgi:hypothetical protein
MEAQCVARAQEKMRTALAFPTKGRRQRAANGKPLSRAVSKVCGSVACDQSQYQRKNDRSYYGYDDGHDEAVSAAEANMLSDKSSDERADDPDNNVHDDAIAAAFHELARDPTCNEPDDDPHDNRMTHSDHLRMKLQLPTKATRAAGSLHSYVLVAAINRT